MAQNKNSGAQVPASIPAPLTSQPRAYNYDKYEVDRISYPSDLFSSKNVYGDNYVVFYINVPENSKYLKENKNAATTSDTAEVGSAIKQTAGNIKEGSLGGGLNKLSKSATGYAGKTEIGLRQTTRIKSSISLNIPNNLVSRYSMNWDSEDLVLGSAAADVANAIAGKGSMLSKIGSALSTAGGAGANLALSKLPGGSTASAVTGIAANPKKEQLFKNVDFRTFNFEYQFAPRSEEETNAVKQIIKTFKYHMHPEFADEKGYLFIYPSEFEIVYYQGDSENLNLPRLTSSVLVDMSVNYTPQGMFNSFKDGASTLITMNLTFKELAILTKTEIDLGF